MSHNRKIVFGAVGVVKGRVKKDIKIFHRIQDEIEKDLICLNFLEKAPFSCIGVVFYYDMETDLKTRYRKISKKHGDLPVVSTLKMELLEWADKNDMDIMRSIFMIATLEILIDIGQKYNLPHQYFIDERNKYPDMPVSVEECIEMSSKIKNS